MIRKQEINVCKTHSSQIKSNDKLNYAKDVICEAKDLIPKVRSLIISTHQEHRNMSNIENDKKFSNTEVSREDIKQTKSNGEKGNYDIENNKYEEGIQHESTRRNEIAKILEIANSSCYDYNTGNTETSLIDSQSIPNNKCNNKPHIDTKSRLKAEKIQKCSIHTFGKRHFEVATGSGPKYEKIFVSRFLPNTTSESIENALYRNYGFIVKANKVESRYSYYASFCLSVSSDQQKELLKRKYWPKGIYVETFFYGEMESKPVDGKRSGEINKNGVDSNSKNRRQKQNYLSNRNTDKGIKHSQIIINQWI